MIDVEHVTKSFSTPYGYFDALKNVSFKSCGIWNDIFIHSVYLYTLLMRKL